MEIDERRGPRDNESEDNMPGRARSLLLGAVLAIAGVAVAGLSPILSDTSTTSANTGALEIVSIDAGCMPGGVGGTITVMNNSAAEVTDTLPFVLVQHVPPGQGGQAEWILLRAFTVQVTVGANSETVVDFGPISTAGMLPDVNALRVDTDVTLRPDLNPEKSDSFAPCGPAETPTAVATSTAVATPTAAAEATETSTAVATPTETPEATETGTPSATETPSGVSNTPTATSPGGTLPATAQAVVAAGTSAPSVEVLGASAAPRLPSTGAGSERSPLRLPLLALGLGLICGGAILAGSGLALRRHRR